MSESKVVMSGHRWLMGETWVAHEWDGTWVVHVWLMNGA